MAGALGCLAFGVGSSDMANAWVTRDVRVAVPETIRVILHRCLRPGVCAKEVMLYLLSLPLFRSGQGIGKALEFAGEGIVHLSLDERATLTNMAVEASAFTGIIEADELVVAQLAECRALDQGEVRRLIVRADHDAEYAETIDLDLSVVVPMVATPGDPRNGVPLHALASPVLIDIAYGGSCTGGKKTDLDLYPLVLAEAAAQGVHVPPGVPLFLPFGWHQNP